MTIYYQEHSHIKDSLKPGIYYLETSVDEAYAPYYITTRFKSYSLTIRKFNANACVEDISIGTVVAGDWSKEYCTSLVDRFGTSAYYQFEIKNRTLLSVKLESNVAAATSLKLYRRNDLSEVNRGTGRTGSNLTDVELMPDVYILEVAYRGISWRSDKNYELLLTRLSPSVSGEFDPVIGGVRVRVDDGGCTLGFPATLVLDGEVIHTLVTNAHCTSSRGHLDSTVLHSSIDRTPITQVGSVEYFSDGRKEFELSELVDPPFYGSTTPESEFVAPLDKLRCTLQSDTDNKCSYSDAALFSLNDLKLTEFRIVRPIAPNTQTPKEFVAPSFDFLFNDIPAHLRVDLSNPYFTVVGAGTIAEGDIVHKVGATTGWTSGVVYSNCENITVDYEELGGNGRLLCQVGYESPNGEVLSGNGDSGSPVFKCVDYAGRDSHSDCSSGRVLLVGIHHSGDADRECFDEESGICVGEDGNFTSIQYVLNSFNRSLPTDASVCWRISADGGCVRTEVDASQNCPIDIIQPEILLRDSLRGVDCRPLVEDTYGVARYYGFSVDSDTPIWISAQGFRPRINILNGNPWRTYGQVLKEANGRIDGFPVEAGDYILEIAASRSYTNEDFMLWFSTEGPYRPPVVDPAPPPVADPTPPVADPAPSVPVDVSEEIPEPVTTADGWNIDWSMVLMGLSGAGGLVLVFMGIRVIRRRKVAIFTDGGKPDISTKECQVLLRRAHQILKNADGYAPNYQLVGYIAENYFVEIQFTKAGPIGRRIERPLN